jgi:hypothetical protein
MNNFNSSELRHNSQSVGGFENDSYSGICRDLGDAPLAGIPAAIGDNMDESGGNKFGIDQQPVESMLSVDALPTTGDRMDESGGNEHGSTQQAVESIRDVGDAPPTTGDRMDVSGSNEQPAPVNSVPVGDAPPTTGGRMDMSGSNEQPAPANPVPVGDAPPTTGGRMDLSGSNEQPAPVNPMLVGDAPPPNVPHLTTDTNVPDKVANSMRTESEGSNGVVTLPREQAEVASFLFNVFDRDELQIFVGCNPNLAFLSAILTHPRLTEPTKVWPNIRTVGDVEAICLNQFIHRLMLNSSEAGKCNWIFKEI